MLKSHVICKMWAWFVVPQFNVTQVSFGYVMGILTIIGLLRSGYKITSTEEKEMGEPGVIIQSICYGYTYTLIAWLTGWIIQTCI